MVNHLFSRALSIARLTLFLVIFGCFIPTFTQADAINSTDFVITIKTNNPGISNSTSFTIPIAGTGYNYSVDWNNDGTMDQVGIMGNVTHNFGTAGTYTLRIRGNFPRIYFNNEGDRLKLLQINQWGNNVWTSMEKAFMGCENLNGVMADIPDLSNVTNMSGMFSGATSFNQPIGTWDTSNVTNMGSVFAYNYNFNQPIGTWDTSNVTDISNMFLGAASFNQIIGNWNTSQVTTMANTFLGAASFDQPIGTWDTGNVTSTQSMFQSATSFNKPIGTWNTSKVTNIQSMFSGATSFNQPIGTWNTSNIENMASVFQNASSFNQPIGTWDTSKVTIMWFMFENATSFNQPIGTWNTSNVTQMTSMFKGATSFNQPIGTWDISKAAYTRFMFEGATAFNQPIAAWNMSGVWDAEGMFKGATSFNQPIAAWNMSYVSTMRNMFNGATAFNQPIGDWIFSNVSNMSGMFWGATSFNQPIGTWNTSNVTNMSSMFQNATSFNQPIGTWNTSKVTDMTNMFRDISSFNQPLGNWNISSLLSLGSMLQGTTLSVENYDNLLSGWKSGGKIVKPNRSFSAGNSKYCNAAARSVLTSAPNNWTITDGGSDCTTIAVTAPASYSPEANQNISFTFTAATTPAGATECQLLDYNGNMLKPYQPTSPIIHPAPSVNGQYSYSIECRSVAKPNVNKKSNTILVNVATLTCNTVTDVPIAECEALMSIYNNNGGSNWTYRQNWGTSTTVGNWWGVTVTGGHVVALDLHGMLYDSVLQRPNNHLTGDFVITQGNLNALEELNMSYNELTSFSSAGIAGLKYLYLDHNNLTEFSGTGLSLVKILSINNNKLTSFSGVGLSGIESLNLSDNKLTNFSSTGLSHLTDNLTLYNNELVNFSGIGLTSLGYLNLSNNKLTNFSSNGLTSLLSLSIRQNFLISFSGTGLGSLTGLDLSGNQLISFNGTGLTSALGGLYLQDNKLTTFNATGLTGIGGISISNNLITSFHPSLVNLNGLTTAEDSYFSNNCLDRSSLPENIETWLDNYALDNWETRALACPALPATMYFCGKSLTDPENWNEPTNWAGDATCSSSAAKQRPDATDNVIVMSNVTTNGGSAAEVRTLQVWNKNNHDPSLSTLVKIPIKSGLGYSFPTPMSFLDTSINNTGNTLTGDAIFACTAQNLGIVTGKTTFTPCTATTAPMTVSASTNTSPTFTNKPGPENTCLPNTLITLYNGTTPLIPSALCSAEGTYSITTNLQPGNYNLTVKQSNRKGATFGASIASSPVLAHTIGCTAGQSWNGISCSSTCITTEAPSELKAGVDKPYISCTDSTKGSQFKYRISDPNNSGFTPIISASYAVNTRALYGGLLPINSNLNGLAGGLDTTFESGAGANAYVSTVVLQPDGKILIGGIFSSYNGTTRDKIARLNSDGTLDTTFNPGTGANGIIMATSLQSDGKILIGGWFTTYNGTTRDKIARLNSDGTLDTTFNPGAGANDIITAVSVQSDGKILIGGYFLTYNGTARNRIARLNSDGTLDVAFNPGTGANGTISTVSLQSDGKILIGGWFTTYNGTTRDKIARLNSDGTLDTTFNPGAGANDNINTISLQSDGKILIGGWFTTYNGTARNRFARLNSDGTLDTTFNPGAGANDIITAVSVQLDGKILIGGYFLTYNGTARNRIARINAVELPVGNYTVECLYSNDDYAIADTCTKSMNVRAPTTGNDVQGCARMTNNLENHIGYEKWFNSAGFNANISCSARKSDPEVTGGIFPFFIQYNTTFKSLGYLNSLLDIGRLSSSIDTYDFESSVSTATSCAVRVGDGYSTNSLCQNIGCGGPDCAAPSQYLIQPTSKNLYCTREAFAEYEIGCDTGDSYGSCISGDLYNELTLNAEGEYEKNLTFRYDDEVRLSTSTDPNKPPAKMICNSQTPQTLDSQTPKCTVSLPTGKELAMLVSKVPTEQYQSVYSVVPRDIEDPTAGISGTYNNGTPLPSSDPKELTSSEWMNTPVIANIRCTNTDPENSDTCTCAWLVKADTSGNTDNTDWGLVSPLKDIVDYQRIIRNETLINQTFYVFDNAGNMDTDKSKVSITLGVDMLLPSVGEKSPPTGTDTKTVTLEAKDNTGGSGLWGYGIRTVIVPSGTSSANVQAMFSPECNVVNLGGATIRSSSPDLTGVDYAPFPEVGAGFGPVDSASITYSTLSGSDEKIVYCVQDNAKNKLVGVYPFDPNMLIGCYSDGSLPSVPNLDNNSAKYYMPTLITNITGGNYGYELTDPQKKVPMENFRTKLAQNIETKIKQQYCPNETNFANLAVDLEEKVSPRFPAKPKQGVSCPADSEYTGARNTKGYYYFKGDTNNRLVQILPTPRLTGVKTVIVEGADVYLRGNINYFSRESSLVIVALKDPAGNGGNVYVNPEVTSIDATIIADGSLINGVLPPQGNEVTKKYWINDVAGELKNPLTINGRLLTYNTRGGSLKTDGTTLHMAVLAAESPMCVSNTSPVASSDTCGTGGDEEKLKNAAAQDLERFRVVMQVPEDLNNRCTLHVTGVPALRRPDILTQSGF